MPVCDGILEVENGELGDKTDCAEHETSWEVGCAIGGGVLLGWEWCVWAQSQSQSHFPSGKMWTVTTLDCWGACDKPSLEIVRGLDCCGWKTRWRRWVDSGKEMVGRRSRDDAS